MHNGNVPEFMHQWFYQISGMDPNKVPPEHRLEELIVKQLRKAESMKEALSKYDWGIRQEGNDKCYRTLLKLTKNEMIHDQLMKNRAQLTNRAGVNAHVGGNAGAPAPPCPAGQGRNFYKQGYCAAYNSEKGCPYGHDK
jgi:hypothetical protein